MATPNRSFAQVMAAKGNGRATSSLQLWFSTTLHEQYARLERELGELRQAELALSASESGKEGPSSSSRMAGARRTSRTVADEMQKLVDDNPDAHYDFVATAIGDDEWNALKAEYPPDEKIDEDGIGVHWSKFRKAAIRKCLVDPEPTDEVWAWLNNQGMNHGEWERLSLHVWNLNEGHRAPPFSALATSIRGGSSGA